MTCVREKKAVRFCFPPYMDNILAYVFPQPAMYALISRKEYICRAVQKAVLRRTESYSFETDGSF